MKFADLIETINNMNDGNKRAKLTEALENNDDETALSLIQNKTWGDMLYRAGFYVMNGRTSLLDKGWGGVTSPLHEAASRGKLEIIHALLQAGVKVDSKNYLDWTPLHDALWECQNEAAIVLINAGADVNARFCSFNAGTGDKSPYFPLHVAIGAVAHGRVSSLPVIRLLVEHGAELNVPAEYNDILVKAIQNLSDDNADIIEFLLQRGANPNVTSYSYDSKHNENYYTPLFHALETNKVRIAISLLLHGANIYMESRDYNRDYDDGRYRFALSPEMINRARELAREHDIEVPDQPPAPVRNNVVRDFGWQAIPDFIARSGAKKNEINTHTDSIHKSVSESAIRLQTSYELSELNPQDLKTITTLVSKPENLQAILKLIEHAAKLQAKTTTNAIKESTLDLMNKVASSHFEDPQSKITLPVLFSLILEGIRRLPNDEIKHDAQLKLCEHMFLSQTEGICEPGIFNNLVYSQQSILPEVNVEVQTKSDATELWLSKMQDFAQKVYNDEPSLADYKAFEAAVKQRATIDECAKIMRDIFAEYYVVFNLKDSQTAIALSINELDRHCLAFTGSALKNIFETLDYDKIYRQLSKAQAITQPPPVVEPIPPARPIIHQRELLRLQSGGFLDGLEAPNAANNQNALNADVNQENRWGFTIITFPDLSSGAEDSDIYVGDVRHTL